MGRLYCSHVAEGAVKTIISVLSHRAGVEDDDISWRQGVSSRIGNVAGLLEKPGDALGVMDIHLTPVGHDPISRSLGVLQGIIGHGAHTLRHVPVATCTR